MKILLVSAGTSKIGATERALTEAKKTITSLGEQTESFHLYSASLPSCSGCGGCKEHAGCIHEDEATELAELCRDCDGYIFFTPVHYAGASGALKSALGRIFYSRKGYLEYKPASAIAVSRRGGNVTAIEEITRFFTFANMPVVSGNYPPILHGTSYIEAECDKEGLQTIRSVAKNTVWLIRCIQYGKTNGITPYPDEEKIKTSYIR